LSLKSADTINKISSRLSAYLDVEDKFSGRALLFDGTETKWSAKRIATFTEVKDSTKIEKAAKFFPVTYPNISYGNIKKPISTNLLFKNATVWTNEKEGILSQTDVLIKDGKIAAIGKNISDASALQIDATNKHLSCGIVDEHSHVAISRGVNEGGHNSSAEVTIQDVVNSDDINIYRQLAGGVTTSQLLHGSANPIGGQSAIVKWKWGLQADEMLYKNQPKFIKFALGENVKQSNFGNNSGIRFPQSRMGVEQVFIDYFQRAKEYDAAWKKFNADPKKNLRNAPRVDLEMKTLAEILNKERFITCHSYVASEILMLMKVAKSFDFNVNTFTHILEGYKVADQMKQHGVAASTFSDWWGYKFEVNDAIPYNGPIMHKQGVLVGYNSDDAEMSRRLNQEAAKAVMYGDVSEEEAWKFVTLNPAKMLHIDDKIGSIKVGKDADLVLWSDNPLSIYARVEQTIIEGVTYFDVKTDEQKRTQIHSDRNDLINQMLKEKSKGAATQEPKKKDKTEYECDTLEK
jgi:imidazolonepropionase-like amidohydrolase